MKPQDPSAALLIFGVVAQALRGVNGMLTMSRPLFDRKVDFTVFLVVDVANTSLGHDAEITGMCSLSAAQ